MIRSIPIINSFGIFSDFRWPANLPEFKQFNLIYGWNYSGKTTLSRAFRCFELKLPHMDFADSQVQLKSSDGTIHHLSMPHNAPFFRVFNSDFIRDNLSFIDGSATPILVLGTEDIAKQEILKIKKAEQQTLISSKDSNVRKMDDEKTDIEKALTDYARNYIKIPLAEVNYDKTRFKPKITVCRAKPEEYLLDELGVIECLSIYNSKDKKPALSKKIIALTSVAELHSKTSSILARIVSANNPVPRLKENSVLEKWVKEGRLLHDGKDKCQFCGQPLPVDLMAHLTDHFSSDYENLMSELSALTKDIKAAQNEAITLYHKTDFYPELSRRFTDENGVLDKALAVRKAALENLSRAITSKQTKAFTKLECQPVDDNADQIASTIEKINDIIAEHNNRTKEFDKKRLEAFNKLETHYAALFVVNEKYNEHLQKNAELKSTIDGQKKKLDELESEIRKLEQALSEASKGAGRINELLAAYFGKNDLIVIVSPEKRFQIVRGGLVAKNLSEGEKTAIAFAYFITRVQDGRHPLTDTRIVIDDPISSLDANHLFNTYALIKTQLADCRQLFISTHSFEFYNLIREWVADDEGRKHSEKPQVSWKKWSVYYMKRTDVGTAVLEEIPKELLRFKSEYHYLFSTLYHFDKAGSEDFACLLSLPNVVRRFMEAFSGIMIPRWAGLHSKMPKLFPNDVERERVWKFINHYSHNTTITRSLTIPDTSECKVVVQACLKAVRDWDFDYFKDLETEVA